MERAVVILILPPHLVDRVAVEERITQIRLVLQEILVDILQWKDTQVGMVLLNQREMLGAEVEVRLWEQTHPLLPLAVLGQHPLSLVLLSPVLAAGAERERSLQMEV